MFNFLQDTLIGGKIHVESGKTARLSWSRPAAGVIAFEPKKPSKTSVVISVGIHGNETAPIEIVTNLVNRLLQDQYPLKVHLLVIIGNLEAMRKGQRYLEIDMNRLFSGNYNRHQDCYETQRAQQLEKIMTDFYAARPSNTKVHFDLHTAIRSSHHTRFGLLPYLTQGQYNSGMLTWLRNIGLEAVVINHAPSATFSYFSSQQFSAVSCTLELGKAKPFNKNNLQQFTGIERGLIHLISNQMEQTLATDKLHVYKVVKVLTKSSEQFKLHIDDNVKNFTAFNKGFILASENEKYHAVQQETGYILFPNKHVKIGFRVGLLLEKEDEFSMILNS